MKNSIVKTGLNTLKAFIWPVAVYVFFLVVTKALNTSAFGSFNSTRMIIQQGVLNALIAWAMACNMLNDRWDFSIGSMVILSSIIAAPIAARLGIGGVGLLLCCILAGLVLGLVNGTVYLVMRIPSLVTSIGLIMIYEFLCLVINDGSGARASGLRMTIFGRSPYIFILGGVMCLAFHILYSYTKFGCNVRSLAYGQAIANSIGVNEKRNVLVCYIICGIFIGAAGAVNLSVTGTVEASSTFNNSMGMMFEAFPPVFIGLYLSRYTSFAFGIFLGSVTMKMLTAGLLALGLPSTVQNVGIGVFLLVFMTITTNQQRFIEWRERIKKAAAIGRQQYM
jgi:ribose transport system permease protein